MTTGLRVLQAGVHTTVQDAGRSGYRAIGVPLSGALDIVALRLANLLVGNDRDCAGLEMLYSGATLEAGGGTVRIAIACGGARIEDAHGSVRELPAWHSAMLNNGERVRVRTIAPTTAAYLAVEGGFELESMLGSRSTYTPAQLGGVGGRALRVGDHLPLQKSGAREGAERCILSPPALAIPGIVRVLLGPQTDRFDAPSVERFLTSPYTMTPASSRAGFRLEGPVLTHRGGYDLLSEGVVDGSIQVPGSGQPVILIADHPTVGGYPKIATAISADLPAIGRLRIGGTVRFQAVDDAAAAAARREQREWFESVAASIRDQAP